MSSVIYPTTNLLKTEQMIIERGCGAYVYDSKGKPYLEAMSGLWCSSLGYGNKEVIEAANEQMKKMSFTHMFGGKSHEPGIRLASTLADMSPVEDARIFFGNSGSDANDTHIKLLRYYFNAIGKPEKRKVISRERAYHGVTVASGSLTSLPINLASFDAPVDALGILRTDHPHYYRGKLDGESETDFVDRIVGNLESLILSEGPETIAAFIAEPMTGASGVIVPPEGYYEKIQAILNKYDVLFWADEVITGFGRTGNDFGSTTFNIQNPDMMTFAKQLSAAYFPISASLIRGDMYEMITKESEKHGVFGHGYTYSGHPVGCAVALKVLEIYQRDNLFVHAAEVGKYLQDKMRGLLFHPLVGEVRGKGMLAAAELVANKGTGQPFSDGAVGSYCAQRCEKNGLIVRPVAGSSIAICPPLIINKNQVDELIDKLRLSLDETLDFVCKESLLKKSD